jgi:hypothetical protein
LCKVCQLAYHSGCCHPKIHFKKSRTNWSCPDCDKQSKVLLDLSETMVAHPHKTTRKSTNNESIEEIGVVVSHAEPQENDFIGFTQDEISTQQFILPISAIIAAEKNISSSTNATPPPITYTKVERCKLINLQLYI